MIKQSQDCQPIEVPWLVITQNAEPCEQGTKRSPTAPKKHQARSKQHRSAHGSESESGEVHERNWHKSQKTDGYGDGLATIPAASPQYNCLDTSLNLPGLEGRLLSRAADRAAQHCTEGWAWSLTGQREHKAAAGQP